MLAETQLVQAPYPLFFAHLAIALVAALGPVVAALLSRRTNQQLTVIHRLVNGKLESLLARVDLLDATVNPPPSLPADSGHTNGK